MAEGLGGVGFVCAEFGFGFGVDGVGGRRRRGGRIGKPALGKKVEWAREVEWEVSGGPGGEGDCCLLGGHVVSSRPGRYMGKKLGKKGRRGGRRTYSAWNGMAINNRTTGRYDTTEVGRHRRTDSQDLLVDGVQIR